VSAPSKFVLLDRDGVINRRIVNGYVTSWEQFVFLPGALEGLRLLATAGYQALVVSNQSAVGRGLMTMKDLSEITSRFVEKVRRHGGSIGGVYYCPHRPDENCECRKPKPGLLLQAQKEHGFDFASTYLVGDSETDLMAARSVGCLALFICGDSAPGLHEPELRPHATFPDLHAAARFIVDARKN